ncbi:MAG TPA: DUF1761 domain-containing protein [Chitinophagaceae bacterium]|nr:DUF1761 domain-containing protein [Chitinophagaceae bacterium]
MQPAIFAQVNWLAVLVAGLAYFILGALWYSKVLFGSPWARLHQVPVRDPAARRGMGLMMLSSLVLMLLTSAGMALLVVRMDLHLAVSGLKIGLVTGLCFAAAAVSISLVYQRKPSALFLIDGGYQLIGNILAGLILVLWR